MTKTTWGVAVVVAAALGAVAFVTSQGYFTDDVTTRTTDDSQASGPQAESTSAPESPETEEPASPDGDEGTAPESEEPGSPDADEETAPDTEETRVADAGEGTAPETEEEGDADGDEETVRDADETQAADADAGAAADTEEERVADGDEETVRDADEMQAADADAGAAADTEEERVADGDKETARDGGEPRAGEGDQGRDDSETALEEEAEAYVEQLGEPTDEPIQMEGTAGFASPDQPVASPEADDSGDQDEPRDGDDETEASAAQDTAGDAGDTAADAVDSEIADEARRTEIEAAEAPTVMADAEPVEPAEPETEPAEAEAVAPTEAPEAQEANDVDGDGEDRVAAEDVGVSDSGAPSIDLPVTEQSPVTLADLLGPEETIPSDAVLYVHTVTPQDKQGIWGIVHEGILENFARGVAVHRGESTETYQVDIPENADERRPDNSSSFLGRLIYDKTRRSYVYNYNTERIGRNPDLILPGEEIVIVSFTPEELVAVYKHFVRNEGQSES